jgi:polysaccharide deacetylase family protein (PEP-CTERM system associated)
MKSDPEQWSILTLDVEEWFHAHNYRTQVDPASWGDRPRRARLGVERLLRLCEDLGGRATWFILGWTAEREPDLIREIASAGHEIGCHTYSHPVAYELDEAAFRDDTRRGRDAIASAIGTSPTAYRAASFTILPRNYWALDILREEGFRVDSSLFPVSHPRYGNPGGPRRPFRLGAGDASDLLVLPMTTLRLAGRNLPFSGGGYFRLFPAPLIRSCAGWVQRVQKEPVIWYFHPWELDAYRPDVDLYRKLGRALRGQRMMTIGEYAAAVRDDAPVITAVDQIPAASGPV